MKLSNCAKISTKIYFIVILTFGACLAAIPSSEKNSVNATGGSTLALHKTSVFGGYLTKFLRARGAGCEDVPTSWINSYSRWSLKVEGHCMSLYESPNCQGTRTDIYSQTQGRKEKFRDYLKKVKVSSFRECPQEEIQIGERSQIGTSAVGGQNLVQHEEVRRQNQEQADNGPSPSWNNIENMVKILSQLNKNTNKVSRRDQVQLIRRQTTTRRSYVKKSLVTFFAEPNFQGSQRFFSSGNIYKCANLPVYLQRRLSSIQNPNECVRLYDGYNCKGQRSIQIQADDPLKNNLASLDFDDAARSFGPCEEFQKLGLELHNYYRGLHGSPPLRMVESLNLAAQIMADYLVTQPALPKPIGFISAELFYAVDNGPGDKLQLVRNAIDSWYKEGEKYDYQNPVSSRFTQLVWKNMQNFGIGVATIGNRSVVVANYFPRGNFQGQFAENVLPLHRQRLNLAM